MEHADLGKVALDAIGVAHGTSTHVVRFTPSATPARVFIDPLRTRRVVCELVENAARWSNAGSAYMQWDVVWGGSQYDGYIQTPDGRMEYLSLANLNDGVNESTGHYYICP